MTAFDQATAQCHSLADAVDREICLARAAMASADAGVRDLSSSPEQRKRWQSIRDAQQAKIHRLEAMDPEARRQFNELSLRAAEAKAAASSH